jgi:hypothetical protein
MAKKKIEKKVAPKKVAVKMPKSKVVGKRVII